jgi:hypothetical protein
MRLIDALAETGKPFDIPDAARDDLPAFFVEMGYKVGAEIGVYKGRYSRLLLEAGLKMYCIDPWQAYGPYVEGKAVEVVSLLKERQDYLYLRAQRELRPWLKSGQCEIIRKPSMEAVEAFAPESLDFVYIDGNHGFRFIAEDLAEWHFRVRKAGVVAGHDYCQVAKGPRDPFVCHVPYVVRAFTEMMGVPSWYVIGSREKDGEDKRDPFRSWFWVRP